MKWIGILSTVGILMFCGARFEPIKKIQPISALSVSSDFIPVVMQEPDEIQSEADPKNNGLNGISLGISPKELIVQYGQPKQILIDKLFGTEEYLYSDVVVGLADNVVTYVSIPAAVGSFIIEGHVIMMNFSELTSYFGKPDYVSEDGIVYLQDEGAIKIFLDEVNGTIISVNYFDPIIM